MKANHICKYSKCNLGKDGGQKKYYACEYCDASKSWKSMACCVEHYNLYIEEVLEARGEGKKVDTLPNRIDKSKKEVEEIVNMPLKEAARKTKEELKDYAKDIEEIGIPATVEKINREIDKEVKFTKKKGRKTNGN